MYLLKFFYLHYSTVNKQKLAWFVGYLDLCANRNMFKKHISTSFTVSFSAKTFNAFVNYLKP